MKLAPIELYKKMLLNTEPPVDTVRASCFAGYWYCSEKARLQAMGVNEEQSSPTAAIGTLIHENITRARNRSTLEAELLHALQPFFKDNIISRTYKNTKIDADGTFTTHGADEWKVTDDRQCWILEYKTKGCNYVTPVDISPARFQD